MLQTLRNAWKIEELRKKILFTLVIVLLYRLGNAVPVPYVNTTALQYYFAQLQNTVLGLYNVMSGGAFSTATIFALSIQPVGIGLLMGFAYYMLMKNNGLLDPEAQNSVFAAIVVILTFTSGSALIMWLGEQITEFGIGNGISIILFSSIVSRLPRSIIQTISNVINGSLKWWAAVLVFLGALVLIILIVFVNDAERRLPVQYAKRVVGRKMYGGQSTYLPMKVNMSGVMPIIFAQSIAMLPATIAALAGSKSDGWFMKLFDSTSITYALIYFLLIIFFAYFYSTIQFNPVEVANNLKKNGGYIPGFRPGKPTSEFIQKVLNKITLFGAIYLGIVACTPILISHFSNAEALTGLSLGGTSIIIAVGVALETVRALEAQMMMRNYKGFLS